MTRRPRGFARGFFRQSPRRRSDGYDRRALGAHESNPATGAGGFAPGEFDAGGDAFGHGPWEGDSVVGATGLGVDDLYADEEDAFVEGARHAPSLPIILFSAASGVAGGVIALFISYRWLGWGIELSAGLATLGLLFSLGISGAILTAATGSRATPVNILFSCGVILLAIFFMALCLLVGAIFGTVLVRL